MINPQPVYGSRSPYSNQHSTPGAAPTPPPPQKQPDSPKKKGVWKRFVLLLTVGLVVGGSSFAYAAYLSLKKSILVEAEGSEKAAILEYDPSDSKATLDASQFKALGDGRFNMVLVGVDKAAGLTDSIQVLSFDTINKEASITSIPRDLYVTVPKHGRTKINTAYKLGEGEKAGNGAKVLKEVVGGILGTNVTNFALIDFSGLTSLVDTLGGVDIDVPEAIYDPLFPAATGDGYAPFSVKAGIQKMDGKTALRYARSRKTTSDFDRSMRQQIVMSAIQKKATSAGVVTNPVKLAGILKSLEKSFKTDLTESQIKVLFSLYNAIPDGKNSGYVLDTSSDLKLLTSVTDPTAGYISYPILGFDKNTAIQRWFRKNNPDPLLKRESPTVLVINGGKATEKQLTDYVETLKDFGYNATLNKETYKATAKQTTSQLFERKSGAKPFAKNFLSTFLGVSATGGNPISSSSVDFQIVYFPSTTAAAVPTASPKAKTTPKVSPSPSPSPSPSLVPAP
jgi:LCP family protein required for cell wall assembly